MDDIKKDINVHIDISAKDMMLNSKSIMDSNKLAAIDATASKSVKEMMLEASRINDNLRKSLSSYIDVSARDMMLESKRIMDSYKMVAIDATASKSVKEMMLEASRINDNLRKSLSSYIDVSARDMMLESKRIMDSFKIDATALNNIKDIMSVSDFTMKHFRAAMDSMNTINVSARLAEFPHAVDSINNAILSLYDKAIFQSAVASYTNSYEALSKDIFLSSVEITDEIIQINLELLKESKSSKKFLSVFKRLDPRIQAVILFIFLQVVVPQANNLLSCYLTPILKGIFSDNSVHVSQKIKDARELPKIINELDALNLRFITKDNVSLRAYASKSSRQIDILDAGQVIVVLDKKKNWMKVECILDDGQLYKGWVFTRYTSKFKK